jgi:hypothetical protein
VDWLMKQHGDAKLTICFRRSTSVHDRCKAVYGHRVP